MKPDKPTAHNGEDRQWTLLRDDLLSSKDIWEQKLVLIFLVTDRLCCFIRISPFFQLSLNTMPVSTVTHLVLEFLKNEQQLQNVSLSPTATVGRSPCGFLHLPILLCCTVTLEDSTPRNGFQSEHVIGRHPQWHFDHHGCRRHGRWSDSGGTNAKCLEQD